ncbi:nucleotidyltransferase family protein [Myxococcota bacterium]|nr:nucleotidyltransferase family protein [Myxococcota bacterium]
MDIEVEFRGILGALEEAGIDYAVVGAFAVAIWGAPRATTDIDLLVRPEDADAILEVARPRGFVIEALPMTFRDGLQLRRVSRIEGEDLVTLDLLLLNPNLESAWQSRLRVATLAGPVTVVSRDALLQMKAAAGRPQDLGDIERLVDVDR